jgi:hypothetical protein
MKFDWKKLLTTAAILLMCLCLAACGKSANTDTTEEVEEDPESDVEYIEEEEIADDPTTADYDNGIIFEEEDEDTELTTAEKSPSDFFGTWEATSAQSHYQYGNIDLTVKEDGTWEGNISDDDLKGEWIEKDGGLYMTSEYFNFQLAYTDKDVLVMEYWPDEDDPEYCLVSVLTKK